ncbi:MAG: type IX secretion system sortase PorU [Saprospiraceae bacterium]|nr:type IX secretion system sortase PorU [Saprospiraceae bacterium]
MNTSISGFRPYYFLFFICLSFTSFGQNEETFEYKLDWIKTGELEETKLIFENGINHDAIPGTSLFYNKKPSTYKKVLRVKLTEGIKQIVQVTEPLLSKIQHSEFAADADVTEIRGLYSLNTSVLPFRKTQDGRIERLSTFSITVYYADYLSIGNRSPDATFNSVLENGDIYKISVDKTGIFKIDKSFLESKLGITLAGINPKKIKIFGNRGGRLPEANNIPRTDDLTELSIYVSGEEDGKFDASDFILFYAEGADIWNYIPKSNEFTFDKNIYENKNYYFIKIDNQDGLRVNKSAEITDIADFETRYYDMTQRFEEDKTNLLGAYTASEGTGKEWYGEIFKTTRDRSFNSEFDFTGFNNTKAIEVSMVFAGRSSSSSSVTLSIGTKNITKSIQSVSVQDAESLYAKKAIIKESFTISDVNPSVKITYPSVSSESEGWLDYLQIISSRELVMNNGQLPFRSRETKSAGTAAFDIKDHSNQIVWDVTNPFHPEEVLVKNSRLLFKPKAAVHEFIAHNKSSGAFEPMALGKISNQNLHRIKDEKMIIVYHPIFKSEALRLAEHRQNISGFKVIAAETNEVYNEFSSGKVDPAAIRDMAKLLLNRNPDFRYLLLFGDGSYDYKGLVKEINSENFVPVYETDESFNPIDGFPSDDFYGLLGDQEGVNLIGGMDIYIGRLPAKSVEEAKTLVDKIVHYETSEDVYGDWRLRNGYTADDEDFNTHINDMDDIAKLDEARHILYNQQKVYLDAYKQVSTPGENRYPEASKSLNDNIFKGQLSLTYLGHGGPLGWAQERVLTVPDLQSWTNINSLTVMVTATCSFGAYDDPAVVSPAEFAVLNPKGGAIALMTTTRAVYTNSNKDLTNAVHELLYKKSNGNAPTLGFALGEGKNKYTGDGFRVNSRKFTLLGDPSLPVAMPKYDIYTSLVNGKNASTVKDTINALEKVIIEGYIGDATGQVITTFNGTIYPTVFDKRSTFQTLSNDNASPKFPYTSYKNILFKGAASVINGKWSFSFWAPKNINYSYGEGRISYYATDGKTVDAGGVLKIL